MAAFLRHSSFRERCYLRNRNSDRALLVFCNPVESASNITNDFDLIAFLMSAGTEKVITDSSRLVGKLNRPRLCIIPALILLGVLCLVAGLLILSRGTQDIAWKQWSHACRTAKKENVKNPLFSEDVKLELVPGFTLNSEYECDVKDEEGKKLEFCKSFSVRSTFQKQATRGTEDISGAGSGDEQNRCVRSASFVLSNSCKE